MNKEAEGSTQYKTRVNTGLHLNTFFMTSEAIEMFDLSTIRTNAQWENSFHGLSLSIFSLFHFVFFLSYLTVFAAQHYFDWIVFV